MKIVTVVGARPNFIKAAVVSRALRERPGIREVLVHTGQHYDDNMSQVFFAELGIPQPDFSLGIGPGSHGAQTGRMLEAVERVLLGERPDWALVYGDTNSTLAGALAAGKLHIPVAHVEAGLRSFNRRMPEELNRILTDHLADLLLAPTETAVENLRREGLPEERVHWVGDVMYDAVLHYGAQAERESRVLERVGLVSGGYGLATVHRAENTDEPRRLAAILGGLAQVARELPVVLPLHPRTRAVLERDPAAPSLGTLTVTDPVGYLDMVQLERHARLIVTDSGGVQKEAFFCHVPCVTLRDETEWVELVAAGWNTLVPPTEAGAVYQGIIGALERRGQEVQPYGDGTAGAKIAELLCRVCRGEAPIAL